MDSVADTQTTIVLVGVVCGLSCLAGAEEKVRIGSNQANRRLSVTAFFFCEVKRVEEGGTHFKSEWQVLLTTTHQLPIENCIQLGSLRLTQPPGYLLLLDPIFYRSVHKNAVFLFSLPEGSSRGSSESACENVPSLLEGDLWLCVYFSGRFIRNTKKTITTLVPC